MPLVNMAEAIGARESTTPVLFPITIPIPILRWKSAIVAPQRPFSDVWSTENTLTRVRPADYCLESLVFLRGSLLKL